MIISVVFKFIDLLTLFELSLLLRKSLSLWQEMNVLLLPRSDG